MPVSEEALRRYRRQIAGYRDRTGLLLAAAWDGLSAYDEADIEQFARRTIPTLSGAKTAAVAISAAFFALTLDIPAVGVSPRDVKIEPDLRGPFTATWHALTMGRPITQAVQVGRSVAQATGFDFVQSAARRTGDVVAQASGLEVRWRRVPGAKSCSWCRQVAGQLYRTAESADFGHERDDCDVVPAT